MSSKDLKVGLFLATYKGFSVIEELINTGHRDNIGFVCSFKETNVTRSYYEDIKNLCAKEKIEYFDWTSIKADIKEYCQKMCVNTAFAISWKYMLPLDLNDVMDYPLMIFHDSLLPKYRGFAPTPTAIMCGESTLGLSLIAAEEEVDRGNIILQKTYQISDDENVLDAINKQSKLYASMLIELLDNYQQMDLTGVPQDESEATYSIWRDVEDCRIDWNKSSREIINMVRALSDPYPGAFSEIDGRKVIIDRCEMVEDLTFAIRQPGKIWEMKNNSVVVICGTGMLRITAAHDTDGNEFVFDRLRKRLM